MKRLVTDLKDIEDVVLLGQFRVLCDNLSTSYVKQLEAKKQSMNSAIPQALMSNNNDFYKNCELLIHGVNVAALKYGVESVV